VKHCMYGKWNMLVSFPLSLSPCLISHKGGGALGLVRGSSGQQQIQVRIILVTNDGQGHELLPEIESNFAGIMYPPGYQIITDNIEFIEEDGTLDKVVQYDNLSDVKDESETTWKKSFMMIWMKNGRKLCSIVT
jgi:hypothetical protein